MKKYPKLVIVVVIVIAVSLFVYYMLSGKRVVLWFIFQQVSLLWALIQMS